MTTDAIIAQAISRKPVSAVSYCCSIQHAYRPASTPSAERLSLDAKLGAAIVYCDWRTTHGDHRPGIRLARMRLVTARVNLAARS